MKVRDSIAEKLTDWFGRYSHFCVVVHFKDGTARDIHQIKGPFVEMLVFDWRYVEIAGVRFAREKVAYLDVDITFKMPIGYMTLQKRIAPE